MTKKLKADLNGHSSTFNVSLFFSHIPWTFDEVLSCSTCYDSELSPCSTEKKLLCTVKERGDRIPLYGKNTNTKKKKSKNVLLYGKLLY
jgi:hypothetical protein